MPPAPPSSASGSVRAGRRQSSATAATLPVAATLPTTMGSVAAAPIADRPVMSVEAMRQQLLRDGLDDVVL